MREISELILELLKTHNRVSIPGLGAFVATPQSAVIDREAKSIAPPSKKIAFSKAETWNDGLLEKLYAERHNVSLDEARDKLRHVIVDIRFELDATGKLALPGLGTLKQSQARDINFGLDKNLNLKNDSYGLSEVRIEPSAGSFTMKREKSVAETGNNLPQLLLFGVMLFAISTLLLYLFLSHRHSKDDPANPLPPSEQVAESAPAVEAAPLQVPQRIVHTPQPPAKTPTAAPKPQPQSPPQPAAAPPSRCEYCVIATSLSTQESAVRKSNSYKQMGYKSEVIHSGSNRYRVALGCYRDGEAAKQELRKTQKFIADAWVLEVCRK